jgi:hypothetical protein
MPVMAMAMRQRDCDS